RVLTVRTAGESRGSSSSKPSFRLRTGRRAGLGSPRTILRSQRPQTPSLPTVFFAFIGSPGEEARTISARTVCEELAKDALPYQDSLNTRPVPTRGGARHRALLA